MRHEGALDLRGAQTVARDVEHVVDPAGDPVVAVLVAAAAVAGEVEAGELGEVGLLEAPVIAVDRPCLARPGAAQAEVARDAVAGQLLALVVHQHRPHAEERQGGRARLARGGAGERGDEDAAGLGLPPGVHHGAAPVAHHVVVPGPDLGIDRLAHRAQDAQRLAAVALHPVVAGSGDGADGGGRGVEDVHPEVVDDPPVAPRVRIGRDRLEHHRRRTVGERPVEDVGVAGDPADVRRAHVDVVGVDVEDVLVGQGGVDHVAAGGVEHALRPAGGPGGVEGEQRVLGGHPFERAGGALLVGLVLQPQVAPRFHRDLAVGTAGDQHLLDDAHAFDRLVDRRLERDALAAAQALVGGDHHLGPGVEDAAAQRLGGEAGEDHRVDRADARAGEHGVGELGDHRQVDAHPVALAHAEAQEDVGDAGDVVLQVAVGDVAVLARLVAGPDDGGLLALRGEVAVDAVVAGVQAPAGVPGEVDLVHVHVHDAARLMEPIDDLRLFLPETVGVLDRPAVQRLVLIQAFDPGALGDVGLDGNHRVVSSSTGWRLARS